MSNQKPHLYYLIFDWETGGLTSNDCAVVELVMIALRADNFEEIGRVDNIIVPYDKNGITCNYDFDSHMILDVSKKLPKENQDLIKDINNDIKSIYDFTYSEGSYKVHGIGSKEMMSDGVEIVDVVKAVIKLANSAKVSNFSKAVLVGHNPDFDRNFLQQVFEVTGNMKSMEKIFHGSKDHYGNFQPHMIDTIDLAKLKWHKNEEEKQKWENEEFFRLQNNSPYVCIHAYPA